MVIAERVGHESTSLIQTVYSTLMPEYEDRIRQVIDDGGLRKRPHPTWVWMSDRSCRKKHFMTMAGRLTTMEVERDTRLPSIGRRSLCTSEWYTRSATPQGGTA